jgi:hypothetical protein
MSRILRTVRAFGLTMLAAAFIGVAPIVESVPIASAQEIAPITPGQLLTPVSPVADPIGPTMDQASELQSFAPTLMAPKSSAAAASVATVAAPIHALEAVACQASAECPSVMRTNDGWTIDVGGPGILFLYDNED